MPFSHSPVSVRARQRGWRTGTLTCRAALLIALAGVAWPAVGQVPARELPELADVVEKAGSAVVHLRVAERAAPAVRPPSPRAAPSRDEGARGEIAGVLISADGFLLTNASGLAGAADAHVVLGDKREFKAKIVGLDERSDVALAKIDATGLPFLRAADVGRLRIGEWVMAVGSSSGSGPHVMAGIVSARLREAGPDIPLIKTDIASNAVHAGGPLINLRGEMVGVSSSALSSAGSHDGLSVAVPVDEAMRIAEQLKAHGRVLRGYLGILPGDVAREQAQGDGQAKSRGALVRQVVQGGPADRAGIRPGDIVLGINGKPVESAMDLRRMVGRAPPGTAVALQVQRNGKTMDFKLTLSEAPRQSAGAAPGGEADGPKIGGSARVWGLAVSSLSDTERRATRGGGGVKVSRVSAGAEAVGLRVGDVVLSVAGDDVADLRQFEAAIARFDPTKALPLTVLRGDWAQFVRIPVLK